MKEAIRMVLESIYDPEDTSQHFPHCSSSKTGTGRGLALRRIKEWGTSRWFLEFDIRKCFHTIDRHRLIPIFKEEIDDPKFSYSIQKVFSAGLLVGGQAKRVVLEKAYSVPHSVLLAALPCNIYLHKLDQEIGRIRQKYEILIVQRISRSVLLRSANGHREGAGECDDQLWRKLQRSFCCSRKTKAPVAPVAPFAVAAKALVAPLKKASTLSKTEPSMWVGAT